MSSESARNLALTYKLDLVKIADKAQPPVCKIINYGKFRYEMSKKEKESKKNQHVVEIKEIRLSLNIDTNDFATKVRNACKFLEKGNKVKVSIRFRGRSLEHSDIGSNLMTKFSESCSDYANVEKLPVLDGRSMIMFLSPKPPSKNKVVTAPVEASAPNTQSSNQISPQEQPISVPEEINNNNNFDSNISESTTVDLKI